MAHSLSAKKRIRTNETRREINGNRMGRIRTFVKKTENAIIAGDKGAAEEAFKSAMPEMHRGSGDCRCDAAILHLQRCRGWKPRPSHAHSLNSSPLAPFV